MASSNQAAAFGKELLITRVFHAPRDLVFQAWSEAERLAQWWGPSGFALGVHQLNFRPGGVFHYSMKAPDGYTMWGRITYREITAPEKIIFVVSFSDEQGGQTRAPFFDGKWPLEVLNVLTLEEQDGRTTLTLRASPIAPTEDERRTFEDNQSSMQQGYKGTFDKLEEYLAKIQTGGIV